MLEEILRDKRAEIARLDDKLLRGVRPSTRDLRDAMGTGRDSLSLLVELKRRDPHDGDIDPALDVAGLAERLQGLGVGALVVNTDARWGGSRDDLVALERHGVHLPLVRNDFIIDEIQLYESRRAGADAVFLRPALLDDAQLSRALRVTASMHMLGIVLIANATELERALATDAPIIGISNRDLESGHIDLQASLDLAPRIPATRPVLSCFGIRTAGAVRALRGQVDALCLGSALLRAADPARFLAELSGP